jgi:hypothetical protein
LRKIKVDGIGMIWYSVYRKEVRMQNRRLEDQTLILEAISNVRKELRARIARGNNSIEINKVMLRLGTLYSLLDVERLAQITQEADTRLAFEEKKVS